MSNIRYTAIINNIFKADSPKYDYREGEDKCDWNAWDKVIHLVNVSDNHGNLICKDLYVIYSKTFSQNTDKLFIGNKISFDATVSDGKLTRLRNICGKRIKYFSWFVDYDNNDFRLRDDVVPYNPNPSNNDCLHCKYRKNCNQVIPS